MEPEDYALFPCVVATPAEETIVRLGDSGPADDTLRLNDKTGQAERVGGIKYTIKDGIVYDAKKLLADVAAMVDKQKAERAKR
jgi:hypothetical protein